ncbi:M20 family metallopeptidase [uncultured Cetobacterium sp.]|uniref:M20 metallopeptidase family protein n=1 Tax=uncultured Cetobacterium sp. TaxID=527638 RepID=UPI002623ED3A|nr:amidohydrolase [uncultured Cetobacterium sp.]
MKINTLKENAMKIERWLTEVRRDFHEHPELGEQEYRTHDKICEYLKAMGIEHRTIFKTGVIADIEGEDKSFTVALRGDIDALPILDKKNVEYASKNKGVCHACGHDAHTTIVLGVAKFFYETGIKPPFNIRLMFQPAEETDGGAKPMIEEGALENVDVVYGLHVDDTIDVGMIGIKYGAMNASSDTLNLTIEGESCHGAYPSRGVDALLIAAHVIVAIQSIVSRNLDARESGVITFGTINGGTQGNIVANKISLTGTLRTLNPEVRERMKRRIKEIVETLPLAFGGRGKVDIKPGYTALINHDKYVDIVKKSANQLFGIESIYEKQLANMGVEDFAYFLEKREGSFFTLGVRNREKNIDVQAHNGGFDIDEKALTNGVMMQILNIYNSK